MDSVDIEDHFDSLIANNIIAINLVILILKNISNLSSNDIDFSSYISLIYASYVIGLIDDETYSDYDGSIWKLYLKAKLIFCPKSYNTFILRDKIKRSKKKIKQLDKKINNYTKTNLLI